MLGKFRYIFLFKLELLLLCFMLVSEAMPSPKALEIHEKEGDLSKEAIILKWLSFASNQKEN
jgi:hypothetical protein